MSESSPTIYDFDIAVSYASEDRSYVAEVVRCLQRLGIVVFFDQDREVLLWGAYLHEVFADVFQRKAQLAVAFISEHYVSKIWPRQEVRAAFARALSEHTTYLLPVRLDDSELPGLLPNLGYVALPMPRAQTNLRS